MISETVSMGLPPTSFQGLSSWERGWSASGEVTAKASSWYL